MTTFVKWLNEQGRREDLVGEFATFWHNLAQRPKLSSPLSIVKHLDERELLDQFLGPHGHAQTVRDGYDAALHEWRENRGQHIHAVIAGESEQAAEVPAPGQAESPPDPAEQPPGLDGPQSPGAFYARLKRIEHKLDLIMMVLGVTDGYGPASPGGINWQQLWDMADHTAEA